MLSLSLQLHGSAELLWRHPLVLFIGALLAAGCGGPTGPSPVDPTVTAPPKLAVTRFMAFGNSITEGKTASGDILTNNYPANLRTLLAARYTAQATDISVVNLGFGGEQAASGAVRLPGQLDAVRPGALLLEEGVNDLSGGDPSKIGPMISALRDMVREGTRRGIPVFLSTLLPERAGGSKAGALPLLPEANAKTASSLRSKARN